MKTVEEILEKIDTLLKKSRSQKMTYGVQLSDTYYNVGYSNALTTIQKFIKEDKKRI